MFWVLSGLYAHSSEQNRHKFLPQSSPSGVCHHPHQKTAWERWRCRLREQSFLQGHFHCKTVVFNRKDSHAIIRAKTLGVLLGRITWLYNYSGSSHSCLPLPHGPSSPGSSKLRGCCGQAEPATPSRANGQVLQVRLSLYLSTMLSRCPLLLDESGLRLTLTCKACPIELCLFCCLLDVGEVRAGGGKGTLRGNRFLPKFIRGC